MSRIEKLTAKEEEIMSVLWQLGHAFVKDIVAELDKELHYNTVSTIVRNLEEKGFVAHKTFGKTHQYYAIVDREVYSGEVLKQNSQRFFDGPGRSAGGSGTRGGTAVSLARGRCIGTESSAIW